MRRPWGLEESRGEERRLFPFARFCRVNNSGGVTPLSFTLPQVGNLRETAMGMSSSFLGRTHPVATGGWLF